MFYTRNLLVVERYAERWYDLEIMLLEVSGVQVVEFRSEHLNRHADL